MTVPQPVNLSAIASNGAVTVPQPVSLSAIASNGAVTVPQNTCLNAKIGAVTVPHVIQSANPNPNAGYTAGHVAMLGKIT